MSAVTRRFKQASSISISFGTGDPATTPQDVGGDLERASHAVAARGDTTITKLAAALGLPRAKLYEVFAGEKNFLVEWIYRCSNRDLVREVLSTIGGKHGLAVVDAEPTDAVSGDPRDGLRLVEEVATSCGQAIAETARAVADGQVDAAEGAALEEHGHALIEKGRRLISLGRRAKRERTVAVGR